MQAQLGGKSCAVRSRGGCGIGGLRARFGNAGRVPRRPIARSLVWQLQIGYMATHIATTINIAEMKTTLEISDALLRDARKIAARESTTLRALVEQGLRQIVTAKKQRRPAFRLRQVTFRGNGLRPELQEAGWERIRDLIYGYPSK